MHPAVGRGEGRLGWGNVRISKCNHMTRTIHSCFVSVLLVWAGLDFNVKQKCCEPLKSGETF